MSHRGARILPSRRIGFRWISTKHLLLLLGLNLSIHSLLAAFFGLDLLHIDCKTAFLNGESDVELYIEKPEGFDDRRYPNKFLRLNKSLYGLKQAPRIWCLLLCSVIISTAISCSYLPSSIPIYTSIRMIGGWVIACGGH
jgi:Reverse transcriptase (RNA-dependent DNA polymerase)